MEYTIAQKDNEIFVKLYCSLQENKLELRIDELEIALRLLKSAMGIINYSQEDVVSCDNKSVDISKSVEHIQVIPSRLQNKPHIAKKNNQLNMKAIEKFLGNIQIEQVTYLQENDKDPDKHDGSISENVIGRVIKKLYPSIDKETMFLALNRSAIGMDRDLFEIIFSRSLKDDSSHDFGEDEE